MHVESKNGDNVELRTLQPGLTFLRGADVCVVTDQTDPDGDIQVVNLVSGELHRYPPDNVVTPCVCKLVVL